jgi:hypothetical protein
MTPLRVILCRGCCCGTERKHPDVDHAAQQEALAAAAQQAGGKLVLSDCLDRCEASNLAVLRAHGQNLWLGGVLAPADTARLAAWIAAGAPLPVPAELASFLVDKNGPEADVRIDAACTSRSAAAERELVSASSLVRP